MSSQSLVDTSSEVREGFHIVVVEYTRDTFASESLVEFLLQLFVSVRSRDDLEQNGAVKVKPISSLLSERQRRSRGSPR